MTDRFGILAAGNFIRDRVKIVDIFPAQDCLANISSESVSNGGGPYNLVIDLARLGAPFPVHAAGLIGDDADGDAVLADCRMHGINVTGLGVAAGAPTAYTDVMTVKSTGRRTFFHQRGANALLDVGDIDLVEARARYLYLGYLLLLDRLDSPDPEFGTSGARLLANARGHGMTTVVDIVSEDSDRFASVVLPALAHTDVCFMNEIEASRTTGLDVSNSRESLEAACARLLQLGVKQIAVIHTTEASCCAAFSGEVCYEASVRVPRDLIVGAVGAGDAFAAGFLYGLHEGRHLADCLHWGCCVAAVSLRSAAASDGIPTLAEALIVCSGWAES
jgi:sugar/nucleoside kinase (ribokinase family)